MAQVGHFQLLRALQELPEDVLLSLNEVLCLLWFGRQHNKESEASAGLNTTITATGTYVMTLTIL